ncbi:MAG: NeuD/PglB/VioB family sugar acetyltransferase [Cyclobacteriaceae bacterium]|nr:NeuD/PglB/VioB family sugar acetyltransferase [Cyclobacteriaceae bacterium]
MEKPVLIFGAGSIGKNAKQIFESNDILVYGFLDDDESLVDTEVDGINVIGPTDAESMLRIIGPECEAFVAVDENEIRKTIISDLKENNKVMPINAIHSNVIMAESSNVGHGNFINAHVILGPNTVVGHHCILHTKAALDEGVSLGNFVQIGMGSNINSGVIIEDEVFIGAGVTIVAGIKIEKGARIGAGAVVVGHVKENAVLFGNPAAEVK